jgi:hypothetical protein
VIKRLLLAIMLLGSPILGVSQTVFYTDRALGVNPFSPGSNGTPSPIFLSYAQVRICTLPTSGSPCNTPAAGITDINGNPIGVVGGNFGQLTTDVVGRWSVGCPPGIYQVQIAATGSNTPASQYPFTCPTGGSALLTNNNTWTGNQTFSGNNISNGTETFNNTATFNGLATFLGGMNANLINGSIINAVTLNNVPQCNTQAGTTADAQINNAIASLPAAGGTIDCMGYGATVQTLAAPIVVGSATKQVTMVIDRSTQYNITATGGVDAIQQWVESAIVAPDMGNVLRVANFVVADTANINNVIASYPRAGPSIINIRGITIKGSTAAAVAGAMIDLVGVTDHTTVQDVIGYGYAGPGLRIQNAAGGVPVGPINITNNSWNGSGNAGARPLIVNCVAGGGVIADVNFFGGSYTHPGAGVPGMMDFEGGASNCLNGASLFGVQIESINANDVGVFINNALGITISNLVATSAGVSGTSVIKLAQGVGLTHTLAFDNITNYNSWTNTIQDTINGVNNTDPRVTRYTYLPPTGNSDIVASTACGGTCFAFSNTGINPNTAGWKSLRTVAGCATGAAAGASCDVTVTWPTAFQDGNYTPQCNGFGVTSGVPLNGAIVSKVAASLVFRTVAATAAAAQFTNIYCIGAHD